MPKLKIANEALAGSIENERMRSEARLRSVIEAAPNAMLMVGEKGLITLVNAEAEILFGYDRCELLNKPTEILIPDRFRAQHRALRSSFFKHPAARAMGDGRGLFGLRKDGTEVPVELGLNPLQIDEGTFALASVIDISSRLNTERLLRAEGANRLRRSILDTIPFSVIATDLEGRIVSSNPAAERLLGYGRQELVGLSCLSIYETQELEERSRNLSRQLEQHISSDFSVIIASGQPAHGDESEWTYIRRQGDGIPVNVAIAALRDDGGSITGFLQVAYDITQRKRAEGLIRHLAHHDALTGLPNRALMLDRLDMAIRTSVRHGGQVAVLMLDLDHFKNVNDTLGHHIGDRLLLEVAERLKRCVRDVDTVARLGGDEFVIVLAEGESRSAFTPILKRIVDSLNDPSRVDGFDFLVTASVGASLYPTDGLDTDDLLKFADQAMYKAKSLGRSQYQWFDRSLMKLAEDHLALGGALLRAINEDTLTVNYQPFVCLSTGAVEGMEALVRWQHDGVDIPPERFIPVAEQAGLMVRLSDWVLRTACRQGVEIQAATGRALMLSVNVASGQFRDRGWLDMVESALSESGFPAGNLEIEITEGTLMRNPDEAAAILHALQKLGLRVVVDDFGTGYSSLSYLTRFPVDKIKIDRSFVRGLGVNIADEAITSAIIAMAQTLKMTVTAEGVESEEQLQFVRGRGCDQAQGFLYSKAVPAEAFAALYKRL
ncbi:MAG: hypothetical protein JWQ90_5601 [Hydrocarboniphaga sp.]|uniref:putative bifunctional diguanylate cyclase/phosphodiesterase n=1 Tax=Hydrocarboniphaga sp. TaxID=2033016 RepID=UPI00260D8E02|nr:EAL domain-containing protein [Hydrocarboniphaga sp.]MDB5973151.1 hypothetical protein [Hydrocarboniphaga sp.]